jgi:type IV pilus assembly protein PilM
MAIAEGKVCRFTRVVGGGLESMASDIAERYGVPLLQAREMLAAVDLDASSEDGPAEGGLDVRPVLSSGVREIAGEVRNSLDFHRSQDGGGEVSGVVLSGPALEISGFANALQSELRVPVTPQTVGLFEEGSAGNVSVEHLAIAAGLAAEETPR